MATRISLTYCGMDGEGRTVTEAKQDAARKLEAALSGSYTPEMIVGASRSILVYRHPMFGWQYSFVENGAIGIGTCHSRDGRDETIRHARMHLAQNDIGVASDDGMSILSDPFDRKAHAKYIGWQKAMKAAVAEGREDCDETRHWADENASRFAPAA